MWPFKKKAEETQARKPNYLALKAANKRSFDAASNKLIEGWTTRAQSPDYIINMQLAKLQARSREQYNNNDYARKYISLIKNNVVGNGFILQALSKNNQGQLDQLDNDAIEAAFKRWGRAEFSDYMRRTSFVERQNLFISTVAVDGEAITRIHDDRKNPFGFSISLMDTQLLPVDHNRDLSNGHIIRFSIEFDAQQRPVAYYFIVQDKMSFDYSHGGHNYIIVPASEIIHSFRPEWVNQKRGIPWMSTSLFRMNMLKGYEEAAITAARAGAAKMGFFQSATGEEYVGDDVDSDGSIISTFEAGTMEQLPDGVTFHGFDPKYPEQQYMDFIKTCLRGISSGLGVSYNSLANDLEGVNFSSIRAGLLEERDAWKAIQDWMIESWLMPIFERWLTWALLKKQVVNAAGAALPSSRIDKFLNARFQARRWDWVDPLKDAKTEIELINAKLKSRNKSMRERGYDPEDIRRELEDEAEWLKQFQQEPDQASGFLIEEEEDAETE